MSDTLASIYRILQRHFGSNPAWWPIFGDDAPFEMLLGAVLVQQTRWEAVEQVILRLRAAGLLSVHALAQADAGELAPLLRPAAFHTQKAPGLIAISGHIRTHYAGSTAAMLNRPTAPLRQELLGLPRIGPETADVVLLYAGKHPVFVVDDYTRRLLGRVHPTMHTPLPARFTWERARYAIVQQQIEQDLTTATRPDTETQDQTALYADYHALINEACVRYCLARNPRCDGPPARRVYSIQEGRESYLDRDDGCPLRDICAFYQARRT
jgi:endonuclease-3 related protein